MANIQSTSSEKKKRTDYSKGAGLERMQGAIDEFREAGGFDSVTGRVAKQTISGYWKVDVASIAKSWDVNLTALRTRITASLSQEHSGRPFNFTVEEDQHLIDIIKLRALFGRPIATKELQTLALDFKKSKTLNVDAKLGHNWATDFLDKHKNQLVSKAVTFTNKNKLRPLTVQDKKERINDFFDLLEALIDETGLVDHLDMLNKVIFNCDETGISLKPREVKFLLPRGQKGYCLTEKACFEYTTVMACGNANGDILRPFVIYRNVPLNVPDKFKTWGGAVYRSGPKGWMTSDLFYDWFITIFIPDSNALRPQDYMGPLILLYDGASSHFSEKVFDAAKENNILILKFPSNLTHVLQPLDLCFFGPLKKIYGKLLRDRLFTPGPVVIAKEHFAGLLKEAFSKIKPEWLQQGFRKSGILTNSGVNRNAIEDKDLIQLPYLNNGTILLSMTNEELAELDFPPLEEPMATTTRQLFTQLQSLILPVEKETTFITKAMRKGRGGYAAVLTTPKKTTTIDVVSPGGSTSAHATKSTPSKDIPIKKSRQQLFASKTFTCPSCLDAATQTEIRERNPLDDCHKCFEDLETDSDEIIHWIKCDGCFRWYHLSCVPVDELELQPEDFWSPDLDNLVQNLTWLCPTCKNWGPSHEVKKESLE